jgi:transcriptional regulator with XRE-family HTH domain
MKRYISTNMKYLRKLTGKTQTDIALQIGKGHTTIGNFEKKISEPTLDEIFIIARFLR